MLRVAAAAAGLVASPAAAHAPVLGIEGFYTGLLHPISTPSHALALLALGLVAAATWPARFPALWISFAVAVLLGLGAATVTVGAVELSDGALLALAAVAGALVALLPTAGATCRIGLAALAGLALGLGSLPDPGPLRAVIITSAGAFFGANVALLFISGGIDWLGEHVDRPWLPIVFRIAAAWIAAIAAMMLAFSFAPAPGGDDGPVQAPAATSRG